MEAFFEHIHKQFEHQLPFVAYKKPDELELKGLLQHNDTLYKVSDFSESGFVFAPFDNAQTTVLIPLQSAESISVQINETYFNTVDFSVFKTSPHPATANYQIEKLTHIERVEKAIETIERGAFSKVVLSRSEGVPNIHTSPLDIFKRLLKRYPTAFVYIWYHPKVGLWLGATPETLLQTNDNHLKTMALAGTQPFEGATDVVWKEKEKEEQQIVTDFIVESLEASVPKRKSGGIEQNPTTQINCQGPKTVQAGNLLHLQTEISMRLPTRNLDLQPVLNALHPTPAVCGFPKEKTKNYILAYEGYSREFYAGFMGELHFKETVSRNTNRRNIENNAYRTQKVVSNLYVNLRCMQVKKDNNIIIYVGGGITKESDPEAEWLETVNKSQIIKSVL